MIRFLRKLANDRRGNMLVIAGAALPLLVGAAGLATDTIQWTLWKRELQRAADSGAIAGVYTRVTNDTQTDVEGAVNLDLAKYSGVSLDDDATDIELLGDDGEKTHQVRVTLAVSKKLPFSSLFMATPPTIHAVSTAATVPGADEFCVLATDPTASKTGIEITGSTYLDLGSCSLMANSKHPSQAASNGNTGGGGGAGSGSTVKAKSLAAAGGVKYSNTWEVDDYDPNSPPIIDPFGPDGVQPLPNPKSSDCTKNVTTDMTKNQAYPMDRTVGTGKDVAGSTVCFNQGGGLKVQGALKLQDGVTYIINGGDLTMSNSSSSLSCNHCTIIMTNFANPANTGNVKITGGTLSITAPVDDGLTYKGVAFYQDRRATDSGATGQNQINGNNGASITGAVYFANRSLLYNGGSQTVAACMQIVSRRVSFSGNSNFALTSECPLSGMTPVGGGQRVRLVA
jgi:Flp pilus assembly protein TadG